MDKKALLAIALCGVLFVVYIAIQQKYYAPQEPVSEETVSQKPLTPAEEMPSKPEITPVSPTKTEELEASSSDLISTSPPLFQIELEKDIVLENDELKTLWTNQGAALISAKLKRFKDQDGKEVLELLKSEENGPYHLTIGIPDWKYPIENLRYTVKEKTSNKIVFEAMMENGLKITKSVALQPGKYHIDIDVILENTSDSNINTRYTFTAATGILREGDPKYDIATVTRIDVGRGGVNRKYPADLETPYRNESKGISWAGVNNKYFAAVLKPDTSELVDAAVSQMVTKLEPSDMLNLTVKLETTKIEILPHGAERHAYIYYIGPKQEEVLSQYGNLVFLIDYGWTSAICKYLIKILNFFYGITHNYGVSILMLTLLVKSLLFPLTKKSQVSMYRMQKLQPEIGKLREKHKGDKQKMGQEQMALFKKHGVNPMGGCLPMVFQLPVFFALFRTLQLSFEMRQASFIFWINDLSRPDTLTHLPFSLPVIGNMLNILPIIMTIASFIQTRMTPKSPDPQQQAQQKMMAFMPIIFAFILYNMPSGLTLYWTTSTLLSIGEQFLIRRIVKKRYGIVSVQSVPSKLPKVK
ncbi:MAG TPA: membrane protein insertase YidC [Candidatus Brocadiia bacterium]|nr:membrane protein insertase YidC [Candidatus Brocadiales bacterium]